MASQKHKSRKTVDMIQVLAKWVFTNPVYWIVVIASLLPNTKFLNALKYQRATSGLGSIITMIVFWAAVFVIVKFIPQLFKRRK